MNRVRESRISIIFVLILLTLTIYGICLAHKNYYHQDKTEISPADNIPPSAIELMVPESEFDFKPNMPELIRSLISLSNFAQDKIRVTDLRATVSGDLEFSISINIEWKDDYYNRKSKAYDYLRLEIVHGIEDLYDKEFNLEKSIATNVENIEKLQHGILLNMKAFAMDGQVLEPEEVQKVIENGSVKLFDKIERKLLGKVTESLSEEGFLSEYQYSDDKSESNESSVELYSY